MAGNKGTLYLLPSLLGDTSPGQVIPDVNVAITQRISYFIVEEIKTARRFLTSLGIDLKDGSREFSIFNEHSDTLDVSSYLIPALNGHDMGLLSEAGLPCIADPGALIVRQAHLSDIKVVPLSGPSSIFMALMASGFNGQKFSFQGYLPVDKQDRIRTIKELDRIAKKDNTTQIFIETPYRNNQLLEVLVKTCAGSTWLCIATDLSCPGESVISMPINDWKSSKKFDINKKPAVFLLSSGSDFWQ